jgi:hypothetical protein
MVITRAQSHANAENMSDQEAQNQPSAAAPVDAPTSLSDQVSNNLKINQLETNFLKQQDNRIPEFTGNNMELVIKMADLVFATVEARMTLNTIVPYNIHDLTKVAVLQPKLGTKVNQEFLQHQRLIEPDIDSDYEKLKTALHERYVNKDAALHATMALKSLQHTGSIADYTLKFEDYMSRTFLNITDFDKCNLYIAGLSPEFAMHVRTKFQSLTNTSFVYSEVTRAAQTYSNLYATRASNGSRISRPKLQASKPPHLTPPPGLGYAEPEWAKETAKLAAKQYKSSPDFPKYYPDKLQGSLNTNNPQGEELRAFLKHNGLCEYCRLEGHVQANCPKVAARDNRSNR